MAEKNCVHRIGIGYDVHPLAKGRHLIIGGVDIPSARGLAGHSDADPLAHAICDAILGGICCGDIGSHFPDTDPRYKDIDSMLLLRRVAEMAGEKGYAIVNIDATVVAQAPRLSPYRGKMQEQIAAACCIDKTRVNVKATTTEGLGFTGKGEGIAAYAVVLLEVI